MCMALVEITPKSFCLIDGICFYFLFGNIKELIVLNPEFASCHHIAGQTAHAEKNVSKNGGFGYRRSWEIIKNRQISLIFRQNIT